jgi:polyhydroxybutyrate depolymerase
MTNFFAHRRVWLWTFLLTACSANHGNVTNDPNGAQPGNSGDATGSSGSSGSRDPDGGGSSSGGGNTNGSGPGVSDAATPDDGDGGTSNGGDAGPAVPPVASCGSTCDWKAGDYPPNIRAQEYLEIANIPGQNGPRGFKAHLPPSYDPAKPMPLLFAIHGLAQNAVMFAVEGSGWPAKSDKEGFILIMPTGNEKTGTGWGTTGSWNGGSCCGGAQSSGVDDVSFFRAMIGEVRKHANVDLGRVYATGLSNGAYMSYRLACEAADVFAAVAPGAGGVVVESCKPSRPISVLAIHGDADPIVNYGRSYTHGLDTLAAGNQCSTMTAAASDPPSTDEASCITYTGCPGGIEVSGCTIASGGHCWFGDPTCGTGAAVGTVIVGNNSKSFNNTDAAWAFLKRFRK